MRGRGGQAVLMIRVADLAAPSSVTGFARATFPLEGGRLFARPFSRCFLDAPAARRAVSDEVSTIIYRRRKGKKVPFVCVFFQSVLLFR